MAAVTFGSTNQPQRHVVGDLIERYFTINGPSGSTLATGMINIVWAEMQPFCLAGTASLITGISVSGGTLTFTSSGTMVNEVICVSATKG